MREESFEVGGGVPLRLVPLSGRSAGEARKLAKVHREQGAGNPIPSI